MSDNTPTSTFGDEPGQIAAVAILGVVIILLFGVAVVGFCVFLRKRELLCFRTKRSSTHKNYSDTEYSYLYEKQNERVAPRRRFLNKAQNKLQRSQTKQRADPFNKRFSEIPLDIDLENEPGNWENPLFDHKNDAAISIQSWWRMIRVRLPYLQLREAVILCQAVFKGQQTRKMVSQHRKEKQERDRMRKKERTKQGTLASLKFYDVKGYGFAEVEQLYGLETMRSATEQLRQLYGGKGKLRLKLTITVKGVKLYEHGTMRHFATVKMSTISFCSLDPKNKKIFAFINRKKKRNFCHVFQCHEGDAQRMVETMAEAFEFTFKLLEQSKLQEEQERLAKREEMKKREAIRKSNLELDEEVDKMLKYAESVSVGTPSPAPRRNELKVDVHQEPRPHVPHIRGSPQMKALAKRSPKEQASRHSITSTGSSLVVSRRAEDDPAKKITTFDSSGAQKHVAQHQQSTTLDKSRQRVRSLN